MEALMDLSVRTKTHEMLIYQRKQNTTTVCSDY